MKKLWKNVTVIPLLLAMLFPCLIPAEVFAAEGDDIPDIGSRIDAYVDEHCDTMAGLTVSVMDSERVIYTGYYGCADMENNIEVDDETVMEWGSISKLHVWISVMQLKEKGMIDLDADIRTYLPGGFLTRLRYDTPITMTDLMNHQAGFDEVPFVWAGTTDQLMSIEEWLRTTEPVQQYKPGTVTAYSNWGTTLAAYIVSRVSGQPYEEYIKENIFEPLGMEHTSILPDASDNEWVRQKRMNLKTYPADLVGESLSFGDYYCICYPAGACMSTMEDMQKFAAALLNEDSPLFENPETWGEMLSPTSFYGDTDIGRNYHGFWRNPSFSGTVIGHDGGTAGCTSNLLFDPEKRICIAVMVNQHEDGKFTDGLPDLVFDQYEGYYPDCSGILQNTRVIYNGPLKLHRLLSAHQVSMDPSKPIPVMMMLSAENGIKKLECGASDSIVREPGEILPDIISIGVYAISVVGAAGLLIAGIIQAIRHRKCKNALWCIVTAGVQFVPVAVIYRLAMQLSSERPPFLGIGAIRSLFVMIFAVLAANVVLGICGIRNISRSGVSKARMILTFIMLAFSTYGMIYWELFAFWKI